MPRVLTKAFADEICAAYKSIGDFQFEVNPTRPTTSHKSEKLYTHEDWPLFVYCSYTPLSNDFSIALAYETQHIRRIDSADHNGVKPHMHFFAHEPNMHEDVRKVPGSFQDCSNLEVTIRDLFRLCRITFGNIQVVEATSFGF